MSGDSQRRDEPDFLDDDFVIEDIAAKGDDLEQLFAEPAAAPLPKPAGGTAETDADDVLFTDHTESVEQVSEKFERNDAFAEDNASQWQGEGLELDDGAPFDPRIAAAKEAVADELGALLHAEEELPLDSDKELELVDGPSAGDADGISELEQSGPFVLEDGEVEAAQPAAAAEVDIVVGGSEENAEPIDAEVAEGVWEAVQDPVMAEHADEQAAVEQEGWEALPETGVDDLSEVGEVQPADADVAPEELEQVDGHDIYGEDEGAPVLVGAVARRRTFGMVAALAASIALVAGGAVVVMRPEWVGLTFEPQRVQQVQLERPVVQVALTTPPAATPQLGHADPAPGPQPPETGPATVDPVAVTPTPVPSPTPEPVPPVATTPPTTEPGPTPATTDPVAVVPVPVPVPQPEPLPTTAPVVPAGDAPAGTPSPVQWPIAAAEPTRTARPKNGKPLVRVDEEMMVGELDPQAPSASRVQAVEGVVPGTRAFAQLHNGNYFIGSIKLANADAVTLKLTEGEVTLAARDIQRLTALGSADYEALQKATSGFVRLNNNNRLVGGILSQIADDHIVLEFRSNRVMLPKSAISQVGEGEQEQGVRLDVTREEDDWVKALIERQVGKEAPKPTPTASPSGTPDATTKTPAPSTPPAATPR
jgi:hypothetical protein